MHAVSRAIGQRALLSSIAVAAFSALALPLAGRAQVPNPAPTSQWPGAASGTSAAPDAACSRSAGVNPVSADASIAVVCVDSLDLTAIHDLTDLLSSRIPGVLVQETSGVTGTAPPIWVRGPGSLMLDNEALVVLDGVRVLGMGLRPNWFGAQLPSRLDDIAVQDIATIEVLKGPAAASLYGTGASGG